MAKITHMLKDGRDTGTLILIKNSHFNRTALYYVIHPQVNFLTLV